ncbi:MAG: hypothetical protein AB1724_03845 [Thermodesulfobacteriota bacterium]
MIASALQASPVAVIRLYLRKLSLPVLLLLLPGPLFHFMLPFTRTVIAPGRDFIRYYLWPQMEYMVSVKFGSFPIYSPFVSCGDFTSLMAGIGQLYLPLPYLASLLPGYWTGFAFDWLLLLNLLMMSVSGIVLLVFLRRLSVSPLVAFALTSVTVFSPRSLVCLGYGFGSAAWAGHILTCAVLGLYFLNPDRIGKPLLIVGASYWTISSGHPEEVYYCVLGTCLFALLLPYIVETVLPQRRCSFKEKLRFWGFWVVCCGLSFLLSAAYIAPLYAEVIRNMDFANMTFEQSAISLDTLPGLIYNFFLPVRTGFFGCFGGTSMYLMVLLIPLIKLLRQPAGRGNWLILTFIGLVFLYMAGEATPVFSAFWKILPFASSTRNPSRASLIMPILFLPGLVWLFTTEQTVSLVVFKRRRSIPVRSVLGAAAIIMLLSGLLSLHLMSPPISVHVRLKALFLPAWVEPLLISVGFLTLLTVVVHGLSLRYKTTAEIFLCVLICLGLTLMMRYGSLPFDQKYDKGVLTLDRLLAQKQKTLRLVPGYLFLFETGAHWAEREQFKNYFVDPYLGQIFRKYRVAENRQDAYRILNQQRQRDEVVVEGYQPDEAGGGMTEACAGGPDRVRLVYSTYNRLIFEAEACQPAFFFLSYPDPDRHWRAWVNGETVNIYSANGISQAVRIPTGKSRVEFRYWSAAAFWGMAVSCLTMAVIGILAAVRCRGKAAGFLLAAAAVCLSGGLFVLWSNSLYSGRSFQTAYTWQTPTDRELTNLAYGKPAEISLYNKIHPAYLHARRGVDGDRSFDSCFVTASHQNPWFKIDLGKVSTVGSIVITATLKGYEENKMFLYFNDNAAATEIDGIFLFTQVPVLFNNLPLILAISIDDKNWQYTRIDNFEPDAPNRFQLAQPADIRYVKVIASGTCRLCLNEVEVYPPED